MQAVEVFAKERARIKLILMDCEMPVLDGFEATKKIREAGGKMAIFGFSGYSGDNNLRKCKLAGMNGLLPKPVDYQAL